MKSRRNLFKWLRTSLRAKVIAMAIVPAILIQVIVGAVGFWAYNKTTEDQVIEQNRELAHLAAGQLVAYLTRTYQDVGQMMPILDAMAAGSTDFTFLGPLPGEGGPRSDEGGPGPDEGRPGPDGDTILLDVSGTVTFAAQDQLIGQDWSERKYVAEALLTYQPAFSNLINGGVRGEGHVVIALPLIDQQDELLGLMLKDIYLTGPGQNRSYDEISDLMLWTGEARQMYVVDGDGRVIYHSDRQYLGQDLSAQPVVQQVLAGQQAAIRTTNAAGQDTVSGFAPVPGTSWGLVVENDWATLTRTALGHQVLMVFLLILGILTPAIVVAAGIQRITAPIKELTTAAQEVARGDFDQAITVQTGDEIEALARQFNYMAGQLQESYAHLEQRVRERTAQLSEARQAAETANRAKSVFLANMSHELRTPLNAVLGYSQLMARDPQVTAEQYEYLETIGRSGEHLLGLINDVLTMSKIEAGQTTVEESSFDLVHQLESLAEMFHLRAADKDLVLILDIAPDVPRYIRADEGKLRQVLMNLLSNAIKFTQEGGVTIRVQAEATTEQQMVPIRFEVEDTGPGIAAEERRLLFDPFVQTTSGQNSKQGTGLGLPISRQFVELMGGELEVHSVLGQGSHFRFQIPVEMVAADQVQKGRLEPVRRAIGLEPGQYGPHGGAYRLLVVEDQETNRRLLIKLLSQLGFETQAAVNGQEGVEAWQRWQPDLVWMDMRMPVMDGYEATRRIKARAKAQDRQVVVVALTSNVFEEDRAAIMAAGCDDFLRKPFREQEIVDALSQHLGVRFLYEEIENGNGDGDSGPLDELPTPADLHSLCTGLPPSWASELQQATQQLDSEWMSDLIEQIRSQEPILADTLGQWLDNFEYDKIIECLPVPAAQEQDHE